MPERDSRHGHRARLRRRFREHGLEGFHDYEVIELLLALAIPRRDTKPLAKALIARFGSLRGVMEAPFAELERVEGVGENAAPPLKLVRAAAERLLGEEALGSDPVSDPAAAIAYLNLHLGGLAEERFLLLLLSQSHRVKEIATISEGGMTSSPVSPQRVFRAAFAAGAPAMILVHNHPGGSLEPSGDDIRLTRNLKETGAALEIRVLDHLIITKSGWTSLAQRGLMP